MVSRPQPAGTEFVGVHSSGSTEAAGASTVAVAGKSNEASEKHETRND